MKKNYVVMDGNTAAAKKLHIVRTIEQFCSGILIQHIFSVSFVLKYKNNSGFCGRFRLKAES